LSEIKRLPIDLEDLALALEGWPSAEVDYFLDLETGDVVFLSPDLTDELEEIATLVEAEPERFEGVPTMETHEAYRDMEAFIETITDRRLAARLEDAIEGRGAFGRFKDTVARYPAEQKRWYGFKDARMRERALDWLEEIGVEPLPRPPTA
jgi:uncharacterized protein UPF0158